MSPDFLNNLYLIGGLFAALSMVMWRLHAATQKTFEVLQQQLEGRLDKIEIRLDKVEARLDKIEIRLDKVEARLDKIEIRLDKVESHLNNLEGGLRVVDDRVRYLQMDTAVVKDRLNILTDDRPGDPRAASPAPARAESVQQETAAAQA